MSGPGSLRSQLIAILRPWRGRLAVVVAAILGASLLELVPPLVVRQVVDHNLTPGHREGLVAAAVVYLLAVAANQLFTFTYSYQAAVVAQKALHGLRVRVFGHLCRLPVAHHDRVPLGDTVNRCTADLDAVGLLFTEGIGALVGQLVPLVFVAAAMIVLSPGLAVVAGLSLPPVVAMTRFMRRRVRAAQRENRAALGRLAGELDETLAGAEVVRAFRREGAFVQRFRDVLHDTLAAFCRSNLFNTFYAPLLGILAAAFTAALLVLGTQRFGSADPVPLGTLTAFVLLYQRFFAPITALGEQWQRVQAALSGAERVFEALAAPTDGPNAKPEDRTETPRGRGIAVRELSFGYGGDAPVLSGVSFEVGAGEHVALVGRTGAGKSTIVQLLGGLYGPWSGSVRVAGVDPRWLSDGERGRVVAFVPQGAPLLSATVRANVTLGDDCVGDREVLQALELVGMREVVERLPAGLDTTLAGVGGGPGASLSAGERQLLVLGRAVVHRPAVLVLDEATAHLDDLTDARVRTALRRLRHEHDSAVLTVAHRIATAREADKVAVLREGRVVEQGSPSQLILAGGAFAALVALEEAGLDALGQYT